MDTTTVTAADVRKGDFIHRVERSPLSAVFTLPVDRKVVHVERTQQGDEEYVTIHLEDDEFSRNSRLNLQPGRSVEVVRDEEDLTTLSPVEIDTRLAALWQERYRQQALRDQQWASVVFYVSEVLQRQGVLRRFSKASANQVRDFLREHSEISEDEALQHEAYEMPWIKQDAQKAWDAYLRYLDHDAQADEVLMATEPLDGEYVRRGRWARAFLVTNGNGHVHRSMNCSTCYATTQYYWVTEYSAKTEEEIVEAAGQRACTVCYPSAPVEVLSRPTQMFTPDEQEKQKAREERERKAAERNAATITVEGYLGWRQTQETKVFKTARAVTNDIASNLGSLCWYGTEHPDSHVWLANIEACRTALAEKGVEYDYDKALANARKKVQREGGEVKF